ncbi:MAG TPA: MFS transporter [Chloroflexota bacterium]|nr:MFS transporter [Chloroflexota bacterium]
MTAAPSLPSSRAYSWDSVLSTYLPALILGLGVGIALPAVPLLAKSFNVGFGLASLVLTVFLLGGMVGSLPTGSLIDRIGRRKVLLAGPLVTSVMALLTVTAQTFPELLAYRFLDGWAAQMWLMARMTGIAAGTAPGQRARQITLLIGMDNTGRLLGPVAGGFIATAWGLRSPFVAYGILALLALASSAKFAAQDESREPIRKPLPGEERLTFRQLVLPRLPFFGVIFFSAIARAPIFSDLLHLYAAFTYGLNARSIGFLAAGSSGISVPVGMFAGYLMDRLGRKRTLIPSFIGITCAMSLLGVSAFLHLTLWWYVGLFLLAVTVQSLASGSTQTLGTDIAPEEARGRFLGAWQLFNQIGTSLSPLAFAFIADGAGYGWSFVFVATAAAAVATLLITAVPETHHRSYHLTD